MVQFGDIRLLVIMGGTQRVVNLVQVGRSLGFDARVLSSSRLLQDRLHVNSPATLQDELNDLQVPCQCVDDLGKFDFDDLVTDQALGISLGAPWIFREDVIRRFQGRLINGHGARLPEDRGGGAYSWQIMRGTRTGVHLFHLVDEGVDTGDIVYWREFIFPARCRTPQDYMDYSAEREKGFFTDFLGLVRSGASFPVTRQQESFSTYFPRLHTLTHGWIDWTWKRDEIRRFVDAFDDPYPGASTICRDRRVFLKGAHDDAKTPPFHPFMAGLVYRVSSVGVFVACTDGGLIVERITDEAGSDVGRDLRPGQRLVTPPDKLEEALAFQAVYTPRGLKTT
jgi:methionyl-tRNA formyltransferase